MPIGDHAHLTDQQRANLYALRLKAREHILAIRAAYASAGFPVRPHAIITIKTAYILGRDGKMRYTNGQLFDPDLMYNVEHLSEVCAVLDGLAKEEPSM